MNYEKKYLKYKNKYLQFKKNKLKRDANASLNLEGGSEKPDGNSSEFKIEIIKKKPNVDTYDNIRNFLAADATTQDKLLLDGSISNADVRDSVGQSGLHLDFLVDWSKDIILSFSYLLTCDPPADVNGRGSDGFTPICAAVFNNNISALKVLIDFGGDRTIKSDGNSLGRPMTPLEIAERPKYTEIIEMLTTYYPSEKDKLASQLFYKQQVDSQFKDKGQPRFKQMQIDLKYEYLSRCIDAVNTEDLNLLTQSLSYIDVRMAVSLTLFVIEEEKHNLMGCLFDNLLNINVFAVITNKESIEPLLLTGLNATRRSEIPEIVDMVNRSRVLSFFKILYGKYIFLDVQSMFELIQTLMYNT